VLTTVGNALVSAPKKNNMRSTAAAFSIAMLLSACDMSGPAKVSGLDPETCVRQYFELFGRHDWIAMSSLYSDTAEFLDPSLGTLPVRMSRADVVAKYSELQAAIPDVHDSVVRVIVGDPNHVTVEFVSTGSAPDGSRFTLPIIALFTFNDGHIASDHTYYHEECPPAKLDSTIAGTRP
jgi:ketosteroid isomerase-like protein